MKAAALALLLCTLIRGQQSSANRTIATTQPANNNLIVKLLHPLEPETYTPLTGKLRFREYAGDAFGPYALFRDAATAAVRQAMNSPHEWGGGAQGYGERFASSLGVGIAHSGISYGLSAALHEDNRYFASGKTGIRRVLHAALGPFEARRDDGSMGFSYSNVAGAVGGSVVSLAWAPPSWRTGEHVGKSIGLTFASEMAFDVFREFLPDLLHHR